MTTVIRDQDAAALAAWTEGGGRGRVTPLRRNLCVGTLVACVPYLTLKVLWILGVGVGVNGATFLDDTRTANIATAFFDLCAVGLAVLFVHPVGKRIPVWLLAIPAWIATGLLVPLVCGLVLGLPIQLASGGGSPFHDDGGLNAWVFVVVYGGFLAQAALLAPALVLYARDRWPALFADRAAAGRRGSVKLLRGRRILEGAFIAGALVFAGLHLHDAIAGGGIFPDPSTTQRISQITFAVLALIGAGAYLQFFRGRPQTRVLLAAGWIGTAAVFTESLILVTDLVAADPIDDRIYGPGAAQLCVLSLMCGLGGAIAGMLRLEDTVQRGCA